MTMIYVTHDQTEAMTMADQIILMRQGNIEQAGYAQGPTINRPPPPLPPVSSAHRR